MNNKNKFINLLTIILGFFLLINTTIGCSTSSNTNTYSSSNESSDNNSSSQDNTDASNDNKYTNTTISNIPEYSGNSFTELNGNKPQFSDSDFTTNSFEKYSDLDSLGRCGVAFANIGKDIMPTEERGSIAQVKPSGWQSVKYDNVDGKSLYNRCHLIGYQLSGENANEKNLITGTRYFNVTGMLPFENMVADYVKETNNHVLYRVTPIFEGNNLVAKGVQMEAMSVEDKGKSISFNVFVYNIQPGIAIDYANGNSFLSPDASSNNSDSSVNNNNNNNNNTSLNNSSTNGQVIRGNSKSKIYHCPGQNDYDNMADSKYLVNFNSEDEAKAAGYRKAKR